MVYHAGKPDELTKEGVHEVAQEVKDLWTKCQDIKRSRSNTTPGHPRSPARHFPFSRVLTCHRCRSPYYGESHPRGEYIDMRMSHERRGPGRSCKPKPRSSSVEALVDQMGDRVMPHLRLDASWKTRIISALKAYAPRNKRIINLGKGCNGPLKTSESSTNGETFPMKSTARSGVFLCSNLNYSTAP